MMYKLYKLGIYFYFAGFCFTLKLGTFVQTLWKTLENPISLNTVSIEPKS